MNYQTDIVPRETSDYVDDLEGTEDLKAVLEWINKQINIIESIIEEKGLNEVLRFNKSAYELMCAVIVMKLNYP